jgi:Ca2+-binding RTX toxin-like protein
MAKITGTNNGERLDGTKESDEINLLDGDDTCVADLGDDTVYGGGGNDTIYARYSGTYTLGDDGNDLFFGEAGNDSIWGGTGNDKLYGGEGNDYLSGEDENDSLDGGAGNDDLSGGSGNDSIIGGTGNDSIIGGAGTDTIYGGIGNDTFWGEYSGVTTPDGDDTFYGEDGDDEAYAGSGNDKLYGGTGIDVLKGDEGNDYLDGGDGNDKIWGGNGNDTLIGGIGNDYLQADGGDDTVYGDAGDDKIFGISGNNKLYGGLGDDEITGGTGNEYIDSGDGNDHIWTGAGKNTVYGGSGKDDIAGGAGTDYLDGGDDSDNIWGSRNGGTLIGGAGDDYIKTGDVSSTASGGSGKDNIYGGKGNDTIEGNDGDDYLEGGDGNDTINGGNGIDKIYAGNGDDQVTADPIDFINGGDGIDTLVVAGKRSDYVITNNNFATTFKSSSSNFTVFCFEKFQFDDGTYNLSNFGLTPINYFDLTIEEKLKVIQTEFPALVINDQKINKGTITFAFANTAFDHWEPYVPTGEKFIFKTIPENFRLQIRESFEYLNTYLNVKFVEASDSSSVDVRIGSHNMTEGGYAGSTNLYINSKYIDYGLGDSGLGIFLHELGHILQLDHSANNSKDGTSGGTGSYGVDISANIDTDIFSIMSYNNYLIDNQTSTTYAPADVAALQYLYGKNQSQANNTYTFFYDPALKEIEFQKFSNSLDGSNFTVFAYAPFLVIDNYGFDTLDFSNLKIGSTIDLNLGNVYIGTRDLLIDQLVSSTWFTVDEMAPTVTIYPETVIEKLIGTNFDDQILGGTLPLTINSGAGNDSIVGSSKNDLITGGLGSDSIDGGSGKDTAIFLSKSSNYRYLNNGGTWTVSNSTTEVGTDTLKNIEIIQFTDLSVAIDLNGNAGTTAKILGAVFGKEFVTNKSYVGIGLSFLDAGWTYDNLAGLALEAAGAKTNDQIVSLLWTNVIGTKPTAADKQPFIALLENGVTAGAIARLAADSSFNTTNINLVGLAQTGIEYIPVS